MNHLDVQASALEFNGMRGMIADEGMVNTLRIMSRYMTNGRIRRRMKTMNKFFSDNSEYFGYGIYVGQK